MIPGQTFGDFILLELISEGGMGSVYRAHQRSLRRDVALKVIRGSLTKDMERRFAREARTQAGLSHPNLVRVLDAGTVDGTPFIAMELVDGQSLWTKLLQEAPLSPVAALKITR